MCVVFEERWTGSHFPLFLVSFACVCVCVCARVCVCTQLAADIATQDAKSNLEIVTAVLKEHGLGRPLCKSELQLQRGVRIEAGEASFYPRANDILKVSALQVYFQLGAETTRESALLMLLNQLLGDECFHVLRTKEQLGYIVGCGVKRHNGLQGFSFLVQSDRPVAHLRARIDAFIEHAEGFLKEMTSQTYAEHVQSLTNKLLEKPKTLREESRRHWGEIVERLYHFDRVEREAAEVAGITQADALAFFQALLMPSSPRRELSCGVGPTSAVSCEGLERYKMVKSVPEFRASHSLYPRPLGDLSAKC
eukprot:m.81166 g.81166  ORF g.81166 m.81166 type:complete len:308 (+) comp8219_c0_seq1:2092-3015(+)